MKHSKTSLVPAVPIETAVRVVRGQKVILDGDLAAIYGIETKVLNKAVKRNAERFPLDFMFRLTAQEVKNLRFQIGTSSLSHGGRRYLPYAFTEHGAIMAANVLRSRQALQMSVFVVRAFVRLREMLSSNTQLAQKLAELERKVAGHDEDIQQIFKTIRQLLTQPEPARRQIGFHVRERRGVYRVKVRR